MIRKTTTILLAALSAAMLFSACSKEENETSKKVSLNVEVSMPEGFNCPFAGDVVITSELLSKTYTVKAVDGTAVFENVYPGIYDIQAQYSMTKEEAQKAAPELKISANVLINGVKNDVSLDEGQTSSQVSVSTKWALESSLLISKVYCNGTKLNNGKNQNMPKYYELFNNSTETIYLDGLCIASAHGNTTGDKPCELYEKYQNEATYAARIARIPGTHGKDRNVALEPGKSFVIAWNAQNFIVTTEGPDQCTMNVDLTHADYEIEGTGAEWIPYVDNVNVPDMLFSYDCFPGRGGFLELNQAMFIFFADQSEIDAWETDVDNNMFQTTWKAKRVPNDRIIDAVETFQTATKMQKRIPDALDAAGIDGKTNDGVVYCRRIQYIIGDRIVLQDTNNSSSDFVAVSSRDRENYDGAHLVIRDYAKPEIQPAR